MAVLQIVTELVVGPELLRRRAGRRDAPRDIDSTDAATPMPSIG